LGGIDWCQDQLEEGRSLRSIAKELGVPTMSLYDHLHDNPVQSARIQAALKVGAEYYEEQAERVLRETYDLLYNAEQPHPNSGALASLARERAQAAWRQASVRDRSRYADSRQGDTFNIDARKQALTSITIQTVKAGGGVRATRGMGDEKVGVLSSSAAKDVTDATPRQIENNAVQPLELPELKVVKASLINRIGNVPDLDDYL
jgi:AcrR family transcriptional regulator